MANPHTTSSDFLMAQQRRINDLIDIVRAMADPFLRSHGPDGCETPDWLRLRERAAEAVGVQEI